MSKCSSCKNESVYFRTNEGRHYCKVCFSKNIEKKVRLTISKNNLIKNGDKIVVAFSGGKDSGNLLYLLHKIFKDNPNVRNWTWNIIFLLIKSISIQPSITLPKTMMIVCVVFVEFLGDICLMREQGD